MNTLLILMYYNEAFVNILKSLFLSDSDLVSTKQVTDIPGKVYNIHTRSIKPGHSVVIESILYTKQLIDF